MRFGIRRRATETRDSARRAAARLRRAVRLSAPMRRRQHEALLRRLPEGDEFELVAHVSTQVDARDDMYQGDLCEYLSVGLSAVRCLRMALSACNRGDVGRVLDLPCGYGRVARFLRKGFPEASLTACDLDASGAAFCAEAFGARPAISKLDLDALKLGDTFDLIWCGSLVTHLDADGIAALLRCFASHLLEDGVLVLSAHGDFVSRTMPAGTFDYGLSARQTSVLVDAYESTGFGYTNYFGRTDYGVSLTSRVWLEQRAEEAGLRLALHLDRGWAQHHDIYAFVGTGAKS